VRASSPSSNRGEENEETRAHSNIEFLVHEEGPNVNLAKQQMTNSVVQSFAEIGQANHIPYDRMAILSYQVAMLIADFELH
jgi:hypothetical protein